MDFGNEIMNTYSQFKDPNAKNRERYKQYFTKLKLFLQFYKEKLMLTRKLQDSLGEHIVTVD